MSWCVIHWEKAGRVCNKVVRAGPVETVHGRDYGMSAIPFTDRELKRAWRELSTVARPAVGSTRMNPHRLLLFYAVECGLKAVWLKRQNRSVFDQQEIHRTGHDLRQVLKELKVGAELTLPQFLQLEPVTTKGGTRQDRSGTITILHQAWRYGGKCFQPDDNSCEGQLEQILSWINEELK